MVTAADVIQRLDLKPLPEEGGYYRETYRNSRSISAHEFGIAGEGTRVVSTAIYYLLTPESFSALHSLKSDEVFHFYSGDPIEMIQITPGGEFQKYTLGPNIMDGHTPQVVVPAGNWQGLRLKTGGAWALVGTTVAPGFEFEDFELADRSTLSAQFPLKREEVLRFTRAPHERAHE